MRGSGSVPHLARWFDFIAGEPCCAAALEACKDSKAKAAASGAADNNGEARCCVLCMHGPHHVAVCCACMVHIKTQPARPRWHGDLTLWRHAA